MARTARPPASATPWRWATAGALCGALVATLAFAPARWLAAGLRLASQERLQLGDARGSVWQGSASLVLSGGAGSAAAVALPGRVSWRVRPRWNGLAAELLADCCTPRPLQLRAAVVGWGGARLAVDDGLSHWPAGLLVGLGTPWNTVQPQGQLNLSTQGFGAQWAAGRLSLSGRVQLDASQVSSRLSTLQPMGSYRLTLQGGSATSFQVATLEGSLQLKGEGQWVGQRLRFEGEASAAPDRVEALSNLLNILGRRDGPRSIIKIG
jgi:general secretion pathway protein N